MRTTVRIAAAAALSLLAAGCSSTETLYWQTDKVLNLNSDGEPQNLRIRIYRLKAAEPFTSAPREQLILEDEKTLGATLYDRQDATLLPERNQAIEIHHAELVTHIGVLGQFGKQTEGATKVCVPIEEIGDKTLYFKGYGITLVPR